MRGVGAIVILAAFTATILGGCGAEEVVERAPVVRPVKTLVVGGQQQDSISFPGTVTSMGVECTIDTTPSNWSFCERNARPM